MIFLSLLENIMGGHVQCTRTSTCVLRTPIISDYSFEAAILISSKKLTACAVRVHDVIRSKSRWNTY